MARESLGHILQKRPFNRTAARTKDEPPFSTMPVLAFLDAIPSKALIDEACTLSAVCCLLFEHTLFDATGCAARENGRACRKTGKAGHHRLFQALCLAGQACLLFCVIFWSRSSERGVTASAWTALDITEA